ncbi:CD225/dispanin family protein [Stenotrophomonas sp. NPDC077659]|uniref:CD225/dispanin family protein n=1 Tax=Stenotrophomonas sp. NPDC077659 TaxID=3390694 RepID=UPI003D0569B9
MSTPQPPQLAAGAPQTYLVPSIIGTVASFIVCCLSCFSLPGIATGIVAIVYGNKVSKLLAAGDVVGAVTASRTAKIWMWVTFGIIALGVVVFVVSLLTMGGIDGYMARMQEIRGQLGQ